MPEYYDPIEESALEGFQQNRRQFRESQTAAAVTLLADVMSGKLPIYYFTEAFQPRTPALIRSIQNNYPGIIRVSETMTTSDFPFLTGDILDRMMLARYNAFPSPWRQFASVNNNLRDFRQVSRLTLDGLEGGWDAVEEQEEITYGSVDEGRFLYAPKKYARGARFSFEAIMNDDLSAFETIPDRLGRGGARTVNRFATSLYVDANGPHASLYTSGQGNIVASNPVLSIAGLQAAFTNLRSRVDEDGEPIFIESVVLVVPPALEVTARNIMNAIQVNTTVVGGATNQELEVRNWLVDGLSLVVDPYIPHIASSSNTNTSWYLFASPSMGRPVLEIGFLRGFGEPQLYQKLANTRRVGGDIDQEAGDFGTMSQEWKGVIAFGGTRLDWRGTTASNGSGS